MPDRTVPAVCRYLRLRGFEISHDAAGRIILTPPDGVEDAEAEVEPWKPMLLSKQSEFCAHVDHVAQAADMTREAVRLNYRQPILYHATALRALDPFHQALREAGVAGVTISDLTDSNMGRVLCKALWGLGYSFQLSDDDPEALFLVSPEADETEDPLLNDQDFMGILRAAKPQILSHVKGVQILINRARAADAAGNADDARNLWSVVADWKPGDAEAIEHLAGAGV